MPLKKDIKKRYVSEGNASHPVRCASHLQFSPCFEFELAGSGAAACADKNGSWAHFKFEKSTPNDHYYLQWAVAQVRMPRYPQTGICMTSENCQDAAKWHLSGVRMGGVKKSLRKGKNTFLFFSQPTKKFQVSRTNFCLFSLKG
jgi:hypothetical protein